MSDRMDAVVPREGSDGKTYYTNIGKAFPNKAGGYSIRLNALPIPGKDGDVVILLFPEKEKEERRAPAREERRRPTPRDLDDEVPF